MVNVCFVHLLWEQPGRARRVCSTGSASAAARPPATWSGPASTAGWPAWTDATAPTVRIYSGSVTPRGVQLGNLSCPPQIGAAVTTSSLGTSD